MTTTTITWHDVRVRPHVTQAVQFREPVQVLAYEKLGFTLHRTIGEWKVDTGVIRPPLDNYDRRVPVPSRVLVAVHDGDWIVRLASGRFAVVAADEFERLYEVQS